MTENLSTIVYLIRHAESEANVSHIFGHDTLLTERGNDQALKLAQRLAPIHLNAIYSSDSIRAKQTAQCIGDNKQMTIAINTQLRERYYGDFEKLTVSEVMEKYPKYYPEKEKIPTEHLIHWRGIPQAETLFESGTRMQETLHDLAKRHRGEQIAIVSHCESIISFLVVSGILQLTQLPWGSLENTGYFVLEFSEETFQILETVGVTIT